MESISQKRNKPITFKVTSKEYEKLIEKWKQSPHAHLSEWVRTKLLNTPTQESVMLEILKTLRIIEDRR